MAEMMMMMMMQNQQKECDAKIAKLQAALNKKGKGKGKGNGKKGKKAKKVKKEYSDAQKIAYYEKDLNKWDHKMEGMMKAGVISGPMRPREWFESSAYLAQKANKGKGKGKGKVGTSAATPHSMATGVQGGLTDTVIQNNPGKGLDGSFGIVAPGSTPGWANEK